VEIKFSFSSLQEKQRVALKKSLTTPVLFYGGAKGGGKSHLIRVREIARRLKYPNTRGLIVRKTYPELLSNHIRKSFQEYPVLKEWYNKAEKVINYPNGSITEFSYLKSTDDVYTYQGREYEDISIDEVTQHEEETFKVLRTSLRTTRKDIKPTMLLTGNPGGVGHSWVKRIFIDRQFRPGENPEDFDFVQAFVQDNPALLDADPEYVKRLEDLPEHLKKAYLEGDWNIFAGLAFPELSYHTHLIDPFTLPPETKYYAGFDPGYTHPYGFVLLGVVPEGTAYVVGYLSKSQQLTREIKDQLTELLTGKTLYIHSGHDLWYPGRGGGASQFEEFVKLGMNNFIKAKIDRKSGVRQIRKYINPRNYPDGKPRLFFFRNCVEVFNNVASMQLDPKDPEDVLKVDADDYGMNGDDLYDAFRYALMSRVFPPEKTEKKTPREEFMEWLEKEELKRKYIGEDNAY